MTDRQKLSSDTAAIVKSFRLAFGCSDSPTAPPAFLEGLGMALAGENLSTPVGPALDRIAAALNRIADILEAR